MQIRELLLQLKLQAIRCILVDIQDDQLLRVMRSNLSAQLASDRSSSSSYKHDFSRNIPHNFIQIRLDRLASEQILDFHFSEIRYAYFIIYDLRHTRQNLDPASGVLAQLKDSLLACAREIRNCDKNFLYAKFLYCPRNLAVITNDRSSKNLASNLILVCIHHTDNLISDLIAAGHVFDQKICTVSCSDNHCRYCMTNNLSNIIMSNDAKRTIHEPASRDHRKQEEEIQNIIGTRHTPL